MPDILPSSTPTVTRAVRFRTMVIDGVEHSIPWIPIYCANCGCDGGWVPEESKDFAFYLCEPCGDKWSPLVGTMLVPDEAFWRKVVDAQIERYGRVPEAHEIVELLKDGDSLESALARERADWRMARD